MKATEMEVLVVVEDQFFSQEELDYLAKLVDDPLYEDPYGKAN